MRINERMYARLVVPENDDAEGQDRGKVARNGMRLIAAHTLQSSGDQTVKASTVLPWLFHALGVPPALSGLLVPIRESGSMLPQAFLTPLITRYSTRKWVFVVGALIQAASAAVMALTAAVGSGLGAGVVILAALTAFSLGRALGSITSKDVQGRTIPKGERGQINGLSTTASGLVVITLGVAIRYFGGEDLSAPALAWLLAAGALLWVAVAAVYARIDEPRVDSPEPAPAGENWFTQMTTLLREDSAFRRFVTARALLLVSALAPPFVVTLAAQSGHDTLSGLGGYIIASGIAALLGGRIFGRLADRSSTWLMAVGAAVASVGLIAFVAIVALSGFTSDSPWHGPLFVAVYFLLTLIHTGVRVGRKTYVIDLAEGDLRTTYVAVSNSAMGLILLIVGAVSSAVAAVSIPWALLLLAALGIAGAVTSSRLPRVSAAD